MSDHRTGSFIIIFEYPVGIQIGSYTIEKHHRNPLMLQFHKMIQVIRRPGRRNYQAIDPGFLEKLTDLYLLFIILSIFKHNHLIPK